MSDSSGFWLEALANPQVREYLAVQVAGLPPSELRRGLESLLWLVERAMYARGFYEQCREVWGLLEAPYRRALLAQFVPRGLEEIPPERYPTVLEFLRDALGGRWE